MAKVVEGFRSMISAASDLDENVNKVKAIFGEGAAAVIADSNAMARAFGTSKNQYLDAAGRFGGLFKGAGFASKETSDLSQQFVRLAGDAASFFNTDFETAFQKLRAGLSGESEPLRDFGVFLTEDAVKAYAYTHGIAAVGSALTDQQKIMARVALVTQGLSDAQGDLARTSGGVANLTRNAWGQLENLGAELGKAFLPIVQRALSAASSFLGAMTEWAQASGILTTIGDLLDSVIITPIEFLVGLVRLFDDGLKAMGIDLVAIFTAALKPISDLIKMIASVIKYFTYGKEAAKEMAAATSEVPKFVQRAKPPEIPKEGPASKPATGGGPGHGRAGGAKGQAGPRFAGAFEAGSREAYSAILAHRAQFDAKGRLAGGGGAAAELAPPELPRIAAATAAPKLAAPRFEPASKQSVLGPKPPAQPAGVDYRRQIARDTKTLAEKAAAQLDVLRQILKVQTFAEPLAATAAHLAAR